MQRAGTRSRTGRATGLIAVLVAAANVVAACGGSGPSAAESTTSAVPGTESTVAGATTLPSSAPVTELTATSCTWRWFDRYDVVVVVPDDIATGTTVDLEMSIFQGDVSSVGASGSFVVDGPGPRTVELTVPTPIEWVDERQISIYRNDALSPGPGAACEVDFDGDIGGNYNGLELAYDIDPPASDGTAFGDLVAVSEVDAPTFPLAELMFLQPTAAFDRLYLAPELALNSVNVEVDGTCRTIATGYLGSTADNVTVTQRHGCFDRFSEELVPGWTSARVDDDVWDVTIVGPDGELQRVQDALQWIDVPGGEVVTGPSKPSADEWIDGYLADHPEVIELGRYDFHDGRVAIVDRGVPEGSVPYERYLDPLVVVDGVNYGATASLCEEYTVGIANSAGSYPTSAEPGGYLFVVARDAGTVVTLLAPGLPATVPLTRAPTGQWVGFVDIGDVDVQSTQYAVTDANGKPVPCTQ